MSFSQKPLKTFLSTSRKNLAATLRSTNASAPLTFVAGNESADLDSLTSSLLYAYFRSTAPPENAFSQTYIPLLPIFAADLALRPEFTTVLSHANINPSSDLLTLSDLPEPTEYETKLPSGKTSWILVDHNALQPPLNPTYGSRVTGVIDHHEDERFVPPQTSPEPRIIEKAGSCTSLVVRYFRPAWNALSTSLAATGANTQSDAPKYPAAEDEPLRRKWDAQIAKLALASILVDTVNLTAEAKVTNIDREAVAYLEAKIGLDGQEAVKYDRDAFHSGIDAAKRDIAPISLQDILRKDYKEWTEAGDKKVGIASITSSIKYLVEKAGEEAKQSSQSSSSPDSAFLDTLRSYASARSLSVLALMTTPISPNGDFQRELFIWALDSSSEPAVRKFVEKTETEFQLEAWAEVEGLDDEGGGPTPGYRRVYWQRDLGKSRKQVAPLLRACMR